MLYINIAPLHNKYAQWNYKYTLFLSIDVLIGIVVIAYLENHLDVHRSSFSEEQGRGS